MKPKMNFYQVVSLLEHATAGQDGGFGAGGRGSGLALTGSFMRWLLVLALVVMVVSLGAMTGLTWFVVTTIKDTQVRCLRRPRWQAGVRV